MLKKKCIFRDGEVEYPKSASALCLCGRIYPIIRTDKSLNRMFRKYGTKTSRSIGFADNNIKGRILSTSIDTMEPTSRIVGLICEG